MASTVRRFRQWTLGMMIFLACGRDRDLWPGPTPEVRKSMIHGLPVKSDWLRIRNEFSAHVQKIGSGACFSKAPETFRARKAIAKSRTLPSQNSSIPIF